MAPKKTTDVSQKYVKLDQKEHVLTCPGMYIGSVDVDPCDTWVYNHEEKKMVKKTIQYVPGLFKIFDEILVNAIDHAVRLKMKKPEEVGNFVKNIKVSIDKETGIVEVFNDGDGIEVVKHTQHNVYIPELIFGNLLTSTNYDKNEEKIIGGQNGIGAKACNIFSEFFEIETIDHVRKLSYFQRFENNMTTINEPVIQKYTKKPYTRIRFCPDYKRFGMPKLSDDMFQVMQKRVFDACAVTDKDITVWLNEEKLEYKTFEKYVDLYIGSKSDHVRVHEIVNERWEIVASYNDFSGFEQVSFVNGIWTIRGGKHVEYITNQITKKLIELIQKRKKDITIKPHSVKENLIVFIKCAVVNPKFDSQSKETLTTPSSMFGSKADISDKFIDKLYKSGIVEKLVEISNIQGNNVMKKTDGKKKDTIRGIHKLDDANWAGTSKSHECTLILTEGDSAKTMAIAGLSKVGRDRYGVFPLRGKIMNVKDMAVKKIMENEEITNLKKILGLESGKEYKSINDLRYGHIMVLTDQDVDGSHIKGLLFNLFHSLWPSLLKNVQFVTSMMTPIVKARKGKEMLPFYNLTDFDNWKKTVNTKEWNIKYYKGLGTSTEEEAMEYFQNMKAVDYKHTGADSDEKIELAFNKKRSDDRKDWLSQYDKQEVLDYTTSYVTFEDFVDKELIHFSNYDLERSIPSIVDGLKVSQRKIMFSCFKKNLVDKEIRVAQLAAYVSENASYHHGEASLQGAIVSMAQDFVGSNNINVLMPNGQFGSRRVGGKDASQPRYIHTLLNPVALEVFKKDDMAILQYLDDDGYPIEPEFYIPTIPMILVNGGLGIGTGFSTNIPCYNPTDIIGALRRMLKGENVDTDLVPWYNGFKGTIENVNDTGNAKYVSRGVFKRVGPTKVQVTELPIGFWTEDFKIMLEEMLDAKDAKDTKQVLKGYDSNYTHVSVDFTLHFHNSDVVEDLMTLDTNGYTKFENMFKLVSSKVLSTSNMYLFNEHGQIKKYDSALHILRSYFEVRLSYYGKRKSFQMEKMKHDIDVYNNKIRFIKEVIARTIPVSELTKQELEDMLVSREYMKVDDSYEYVLRIPIYNMTKDKVTEIEADIAKLEELYTQLEQKTINDMWLGDLDSLEKSYQKYLVIRENKMACGDVVQPKKRQVVKKK
jgi:DNA topoisomerase-2